MATIEQSGLMIFKDAEGNKTILYPVTKKDNVDGMEDIDAHIVDKNNPHGVTAEQIKRADGQTVEEAISANEAATEAAQKTADEAKEAAANAQQVANSATTVANEAKTAAEGATTVANEAKNTADGAVTTANEAKEESANAVSVANEAKSVADSAKETADSASDVASEAKTEAEAATNSANAASEVANSALSTANNAASAASNAQDSADSAMQKAEEALAAAQEAKAEAESSAGGCAITITFDEGYAGKTFSVTDGNGDTHEGVVPDSLVATVNVKNCNTLYTITATADNGVTYTTTVTTGPYYGQYAATLTVFSASLVVTAVAGALVTVTGEYDTLEATADSTGKATIEINRSGAYTVKARYSDADSNSASVSITSEQTYTASVSFITLTVTADSGSAVTVTNGSKTLSGTSTGTVKFYLPNTGTWTVSASKGDQSASSAVSVTTYKAYYVELSYVKIFGVCWSKSSSTALSRLTKASDPNGHVNVDIGSEPVPAVGTGTGSSPFDNYAPWKDMTEYNVIDGAVSYKKGDAGFSRTSYDTMVKIPEFYYKIVESDGSRYFYVADKATTGFTKHPGSGRYVGRYNTISGYYSKSGSAPLVNISRATARTGSTGKGAGWYQYDYASWCAVWLLYLVEFADWDSQTVIGQGVVNADAAVSCGGTDSMTYHTGRAAGTDGETPVQYRWIENPWGNVFEWIDGANFSERAAYICTNPDNYADDTSTNYTAAGVTLPSSGYITDLGMSTAFDWSFLPNTAGGSSTTYIPDYMYSNTGWRVLLVGGFWSFTSYAGLFFFGANSTSSYASANIGARLLFVP